MYKIMHCCTAAAQWLSGLAVLTRSGSLTIMYFMYIKALYSTCSSRLSCRNEYQILLEANLRWISVLNTKETGDKSRPNKPLGSGKDLAYSITLNICNTELWGFF